MTEIESLKFCDFCSRSEIEAGKELLVIASLDDKEGLSICEDCKVLYGSRGERYSIGGGKAVNDKTELKNIKALVLEKEKAGKIVFLTHDGLICAKLDEFIKQSTEGLLYDLNRDRVTVLTFIDDPKWINDFAVGLVIAKLKEKLQAKEKKQSELEV